MLQFFVKKFFIKEFLKKFKFFLILIFIFSCSSSDSTKDSSQKKERSLSNFISLISPSSSPSDDPTPSFQLSLINNEKLLLSDTIHYYDGHCSNGALLSSISGILTYEESNFTLSPSMSHGESVEIYAELKTLSGERVCSQNFVPYTYLSTLPASLPPTPATNLSWNPGASPTNTNGPFQASWAPGTSNNFSHESIYLYSNATCSSQIGAPTHFSSSPATFSHLNDGTYYFQIRTEDTESRSSSSQCQGPLEIDTTPPNIPQNAKWKEASPYYDTNVHAEFTPIFKASHYSIRFFNNGNCTLSGMVPLITTETLVPFQASNNNTSSFQVASVDSLGNTSEYSSCSPPMIIDDSVLNVDITSSSSPGPTSSHIIPIQISFSEDVSGFSLSDLNVTNGTLSSLSGGPKIFTTEITAFSLGTLVSLNIPAASAQNNSGEENIAAVPFQIEYSLNCPNIYPMQSKWNMDAGETLTLPLSNTYIYNFTVDWGDGSPRQTVSSFSDPHKHHTYSSSGVYTVTLEGRVEAWNMSTLSHELQQKLIEVTELGDMCWIDLSYAFENAGNLKDVRGGKTDTVTSMKGMFLDATFVTPNTSNWNTSSVINMESMFQFAGSANPDTSNWETRSVKNMNYMFLGATSANPETSHWDMSSVVSVRSTFEFASSANPDTSLWDTSSIVDMSGMFQFAGSANPETSLWDTSSVQDMSFMFAGSANANPETSFWDTSSVQDMSGMFQFSEVANPDTSNWDTRSVIDMSNMFSRSIVANPETTNWNTSLVEGMDEIFSNALSANPNTINWNLEKTTLLNNMFQSSNIDDENYSNFLIMADETSSTNNINLGNISASPLDYAQNAKSRLINLMNWFISDNITP